MEDMIFKFFIDYGWQLGVCALGGIFFLGFLKMLGIFDKIANKDLKKFLYIAMSVIFSVGACALYLYFTNAFAWKALLAIFIPVFTLNQTVYQLYETTGVRKLWKTILNWIASNFGKLFTGIKSKMVESLGSETLRQIANKLDEDEKKEEQSKQPIIRIE